MTSALHPASSLAFRDQPAHPHLHPAAAHHLLASRPKMPGAAPITYPLIASPVPSRPYILDIHRLPSSSADHLILRHPAPELGVADAQTLQLVHTLSGGHVGNVSSVSVDGETGAVWSAGKEGRAVRWDERRRGAGMRVDGMYFRTWEAVRI